MVMCVMFLCLPPYYGIHILKSSPPIGKRGKRQNTIVIVKLSMHMQFQQLTGKWPPTLSVAYQFTEIAVHKYTDIQGYWTVILHLRKKSHPSTMRI